MHSSYGLEAIVTVLTMVIGPVTYPPSKNNSTKEKHTKVIEDLD